MKTVPGSWLDRLIKFLASIYNAVSPFGTIEADLVCTICGAAVDPQNADRHYEVFHPEEPDVDAE